MLEASLLNFTPIDSASFGRSVLALTRTTRSVQVEAIELKSIDETAPVAVYEAISSNVLGIMQPRFRRGLQHFRIESSVIRRA